MACDLPDFPKGLTGVLTGEQCQTLFDFAHSKGFALPAINCTSSSSVNCVLEAARDTHNPVIIQVSQGGAAFYCGKGVKDTNLVASIAGAVALALHVRAVAPMYGVPVVIHSDHCAKKLLPWFDGMLEADEKYFKEHGVALFSSHMLDLSEENDDENIETCVKYFKRMVCSYHRKQCTRVTHLNGALSTPSSCYRSLAVPCPAGSTGVREVGTVRPILGSSFVILLLVWSFPLLANTTRFEGMCARDCQSSLALPSSLVLNG